MFSTHTCTQKNMWGDGHVNYLDEGNHSKCAYISNHYNVHFKYLKILYVNYTSKLKFKQKTRASKILKIKVYKHQMK